MTKLLTDLRSGLRMLVKYPTLSVVAIVTLGLGIGLSTTVFCVVNGGILKGLPFPEADRIVALVGTNPAQRQQFGPIRAADLPVWRERLTALDRVGPYGTQPINLSTDEGRPERFRGGLLSVAAFEALGVPPALGRGFQAGDDRPGAEPVAIIGWDLWHDRFGGSPSIIGQSIRAGGVQRTIVGVMPDTFAFPYRESLWIPLTADPLSGPREKSPMLQLVGRLKPGASVAEARNQAALIATQLERDFPETNRGAGANVVPFVETAIGRPIYLLLYTMLGAGIGVLLIACVNVSNLLVARASLRRREVAVRLALGASRARVVRQHLTEVLVLSLCGSVIGVLISVAGVRWFGRALESDPPPFWITFGVDYRVLLFITGLIVLASLFAGGIPALHASRVTAGSALKDESRSSTSARLGRFSSALVIAELAVSCSLLIAAGLMIKSVVQLKSLRMPFAIENVLTARVDLPQPSYPDTAATTRFFEQLLPRLRAVPGVESATLSDGLPAAGNGTNPIQIEGKSYAQLSDYPVAREGIVTAGYFETFQTKVLSGREFTESDNATGQAVAIVNESFARAYFPGVDPVGHQIKRYRKDHSDPWMTIVGLVPDMLMQGIGNNQGNGIGYYIPIPQSNVGNSVRIALRTHGEPAAVTSLVRSAVASLDPDLAIFEVSPLRVVIDRQTWFYTVFGTFFMAFGVCALFLAAAGLYGVMSFAVTQRTREMGVRSALGAQSRSLVMLIMRATVLQLAIGLFFGLGLALLASGALSPVLYGVAPRDPAVITVVVAMLAVVSLLASFLPARRVSRIDPVVALGTE